MGYYVEVAIYRLKLEITCEQFLQATDATLPDFQQLNGFIRHEIFRSEDGRWLDLVYYESRQAAKAAEPVLSAASSIQDVMAMLEMEEGQWFHATLTRYYSN